MKYFISLVQTTPENIGQAYRSKYKTFQKALKSWAPNRQQFAFRFYLGVNRK